MNKTFVVGNFGMIIENLFLIALKKGNMNFSFRIESKNESSKADLI
jgi:hypothetical protein